MCPFSIQLSDAAMSSNNSGTSSSRSTRSCWPTAAARPAHPACDDSAAHLCRHVKVAGGDECAVGAVLALADGGRQGGARHHVGGGRLPLDARVVPACGARRQDKRYSANAPASATRSGGAAHSRSPRLGAAPKGTQSQQGSRKLCTANPTCTERSTPGRRGPGQQTAARRRCPWFRPCCSREPEGHAWNYHASCDGQQVAAAHAFLSDSPTTDRSARPPGIEALEAREGGRRHGRREDAAAQGAGQR